MQCCLNNQTIFQLCLHGSKADRTKNQVLTSSEPKYYEYGQGVTDFGVVKTMVIKL